MLLCPFSCGAAIADSAGFLGFNSFDERIIAPEALPGLVVEPIFLSHLLFRQQILSVPAKILDKLEVVEEYVIHGAPHFGRRRLWVLAQSRNSASVIFSILDRLELWLCSDRVLH
jgi:hypothetical protein